MKTLVQMFVGEGHRHYRAGAFLEAIRSLKNACSCRDVTRATIDELDVIITDISRELRFGRKV